MRLAEPGRIPRTQGRRAPPRGAVLPINPSPGITRALPQALAQEPIYQGNLSEADQSNPDPGQAFTQPQAGLASFAQPKLQLE